MNDKKFMLKLFAIATSFMYEAIAAIAIGYLIGLGLDRLFNLDTVLVIVFMIIGALAAVRNLMVRVYRLGVKKDDGENIS